MIEKIWSSSYSLALCTDLYQLTMAQAYFKNGIHDRESVFHLSFRENPFNGGYAISCGLASLIDFLQNFHFQVSDLEYLKSLESSNGKPLFSKDFLEFLNDMKFSCDLWAVPEGRLVFAGEPLLRIKGPLFQCQLLETIILNIINFQTLIATKANRICFAAQEDAVLEFGFRRAQGIDAALMASRASYIGGCAATSNVLAGKIFGIPVRGTHSHSWVMVFEDELESFESYAKALPDNCVFLVDTFDTLSGVRNAIKVGKKLRLMGCDLAGIRLDSGDLSQLSKQARAMLDLEGFKSSKIIASNDLDEYSIRDLKTQGAPIAVWGVGTRLVTGNDQPTLGGVYKLSAIRDENGIWHNRLKISEQLIKSSNPGILQIRRFYDTEGRAIADMIYDIQAPLDSEVELISPSNECSLMRLNSNTNYENLLIEIIREGRTVYECPEIDLIRETVKEEFAKINFKVRSFESQEDFPVGLEKKLFGLRKNLVESLTQSKYTNRHEL